MIEYEFIIEKSGRKFLERQSKNKQARIVSAIYGLPSDGDIKPLIGRHGVFRLRVGDVRVVFKVDAAAARLIVIDIGNRGDVYK